MTARIVTNCLPGNEQGRKNIRDGRDQEEDAGHEGGEGQCHGQVGCLRTGD